MIHANALTGSTIYNTITRDANKADANFSFTMYAIMAGASNRFQFMARKGIGDEIEREIFQVVEVKT